MHGGTALIIAAHKGHLQVVERLLECQRIDVNQQNHVKKKKKRKSVCCRVFKCAILKRQVHIKSGPRSFDCTS